MEWHRDTSNLFAKPSGAISRFGQESDSASHGRDSQLENLLPRSLLSKVCTKHEKAHLARRISGCFGLKFALLC
jgi:hypothetical protein